MEESKSMSGQSLTVEHAELLAGVKLFAGLNRVVLAKLAAQLESVPMSSGAELFHEGDEGDAFYLVARGSFGTFVELDELGQEKRVNTLTVGDPFGEMALLSDTHRSATIRADGDGEVLRLRQERFLSLVHEEPSVALSVAAALGDRLRARDAGQSETRPVASAAVAEKAESPRRFAPPHPKRRLSKANVGGLLTAAVIVVGAIMPAPTSLSPAGWYALITLLAAVPLLAFDALPEGVLALLLAAAWVMGDIAPPAIALSGFTSESWILVVSVLAFGAAISSSGLIYRLALWTVAHSRGGFAGQVLALSVTGVLVGPAAPNAVGRITLIAPALTELVEGLGYPAKSRSAAGLAMATLIGFGQMGAPFLTSSTTAVLVFALLPPDSELNWFSWVVWAAPANILLFLGLVTFILWWYRPVDEARIKPALQSEVVRLQRELIGRPTRNEKVVLIVGASLLVGFLTQPLHGVHPAWVAVLAVAVLAATRIVTADTLRAVNWSFALLFGMLASVARVFSETGLDRSIANIVTEVIGDLAAMPILFVAVLTLLCFAISLVLRWAAAAPLLTIALVPVAQSADIDPFVVGVVTLIACNGFFFPYQSTTYLAMYHGTGGQLFTHADARPIAIAYGVLTLVALCASVFAWRIMGLL